MDERHLAVRSGARLAVDQLRLGDRQGGEIARQVVGGQADVMEALPTRRQEAGHA
jgi:hypothetical protein